MRDVVFSVNGTFVYLVAGLAIAFVLAQSVFFLVKAWRRAKQLGMDRGLLRRTALSSGIFTIAPAVSILLGVITLSKFLGLPLPWFRLSVLGALTYELPAATTTATAAGISLSQTITDPQIFVTIAWVMTLGIIPGIFIVALGQRKLQHGIDRLRTRDRKWGDILMTALFLGMISAFLGMVFADVGQGLAGWIPVIVMLCSAAIMGLCGLGLKRFKWKWLEDYALPISMLGAMALSIPITSWLV